MTVIDEVVTFLPAQVHQFVDATGDTNPVHQGENPIVPVLQLALLARKLTEAHGGARSKLQQIEFKCRRPVYVKNLTRLVSQTSEPGIFLFTIQTNSMPCAEVSLRYGPAPTFEKPISGEHRYD